MAKFLTFLLALASVLIAVYAFYERPQRPPSAGFFSHLQNHVPFRIPFLTENIVHTSPLLSTPPSTASSATEGQFTRHIVAVGDLHGDLPNALRVLKFAGVIDDQSNWAMDPGSVFAQTGDIIDRGDDTIELFALMDKLRGQAQANGGIMLSNLGNHEWMNAIGDWRYVWPGELKTFDSVAARQKYISTGPIGRSWAANYTTATRLPLHPSIGDPNTPYPPESDAIYRQKDTKDDDNNDEDRQRHLLLEAQLGPLSHSALSFVHGGLSPTYQDLTPFPSKINALGDSLLSKLQHRPSQPDPHPPGPYPGLPHGTTQEEAELYASNGPLWYRGWALDSEEKVCHDAAEVLAKTGTRRMIMGHTPDFSGIVSRCNGKVIIIDTGISHAYGGVLSALSIHYTLTPVTPEYMSTAQDAQAQTKDDDDGRWIEREVVSALYVDHQEILVDEEREVVGEFSGY